MYPYRRNVARLQRLENRDVSKRSRYVHLDLTIRAVSAIGLVVIGIAGWMFQVNSAESRHRQEDQERSARKYLPMLQALTNIELAADTVARKFEDGSPDRFSTDLRESAAMLQEAAIAGLVLKRNSTTHSLALPDVTGAEPIVHTIDVTADDAAYVLADFVTVLALADRAYTEKSRRFISLENWQMNLLTSPVHGSIGTAYDPGDPLRMVWVRVNPSSVKVWRTWVSGKQVDFYYAFRAMARLARAVQQHAALDIQRVLSDHPEFGAEYVAIRADAVKMQLGQNSRNAR